MTNRPVQGGPAIPVVIVGGAGSNGNGDPGSGIPTRSVPTGDSGVQSVAIVTLAGTVLVPNGNRLAWFVQNLGTNPLYVKMGAGASTTDFDFALKGCTAQDDGTGGYISDEIFQGTVSIAGTSPRASVGALNQV